MKITWSDFKIDVYNEASLEPNEYSEYDDNIVSAVNYAFMDLQNTFPLQGIYEIVQEETNQVGYNTYDLIELTNQGEDRVFMSFDIPSLLKVTDCADVVFNNYRILQDRYLQLSKNDVGTFKVLYKRYPIKITQDTNDDYVLELAPEIVNAAKLCVLWKIMYDDDRTFATQKFNEYMQEKEIIKRRLAFNNGVKVVGGYHGL